MVAVEDAYVGDLTDEVVRVSVNVIGWEGS